MEMIQPSKRIHPMMAGAAASVMLVSLLGAAAITGILPSSRGTTAETARSAAPTSATVTEAASNQQAASVAAVVPQYPEHRTPVHHQYAQHQADLTRARPVQVAQSEPVRQYSPAPVYQQAAPVAQNSPLGIGIGAVVGGLLGSKVGGGNGRTLAAIAGAVGGGYVGNEIAKHNQ